MAAKLKIDFVSDVACPWCAVGLKSLEQALARVGDEAQVELHFQPFELNPQMPPEGEDAIEHIAHKYGLTPQEIVRNQQGIEARGKELDFTFDMSKRTRIYNTFDAHRLLHWAGIEGRQLQLKQGLLAAYFTEGRDPSDHEVLVDVAARAGLDSLQAKEILTSNRYADEVRELEERYAQRGIRAVPSVIVNDRYLIQGGQPVAVFEEALRKIAAEAAGVA